jgi:hypothetical protein
VYSIGSTIPKSLTYFFVNLIISHQDDKIIQNKIKSLSMEANVCTKPKAQEATPEAKDKSNVQQLMQKT